METQFIVQQITEIMRDVFDNPKITLTENTTAKDIEEWDSLNHIQLVVAIEKHFKIRFVSEEIQNWKSVGDICETISKRLKLKGDSI